MRRYYPAIVDRDGEAFGITFPDFPGCVSAGKTANEAIVGGTEALAGHVAAMVADKEPLPDPTPVEAIESDPELSIVAVTLVPVVIPGRSKRYNVTLDEELVAEIDAITSNRSAFLAAAARAELARHKAA